MKNAARALGLALFCLGAGGCAAQQSPPSVRLALDGPPLFIAVSGDSLTNGVMDRGCLAGHGAVSLRNERTGVVCEGMMDSPASDKGRMYAELNCTNGDTLILALRNLGPDQGLGVGRVITSSSGQKEQGERLSLFYHPCEDEAGRRLEQVAKDMAEAAKTAESLDP